MKLAALITLALVAVAPMGLAHAQQAALLTWQSHPSLILEHVDDANTPLQQLLEHNQAEVPDLDGRVFMLSMT